MMYRVIVGSGRGIVAVWDETLAPDHLEGADDTEMLAVLEKAGLRGDVFWVDDEEPQAVTSRFHLTARHQQYDNEIIRREVQEIVGVADWRFRTRVEWAGSIGCLPILGCIVLALFSSWSLLLKVAIPVTLVYWLFAAAVRQLPRYRRVKIEEKRYFARQHMSGESAANLVLVLKQVHDTTHLSGGCLDISS